jgi:peroxiredoxin Q/BCP
MAVVEPGGKVPAFSLPDQEGTVQRYPKDDTPGCTREACAFRDALPDFTAARTWAWPA